MLRCAIVALLAVLMLPGAGRATDYAMLGTGHVQGTYYPVGGALAALMAENPHSRFSLSAESTAGSMENLVRLYSGDLDLALAQSDRVVEAYRSEGPFAAEPSMIGLRLVASLQPQPVTLFVRADSDIHRFEDIAGKRINIGAFQKPTYRLMQRLLGAFDWDDAEALADLRMIRHADQTAALCAGEIDVAVLIAAHPNGSVFRTLSECPLRIVPIGPAAADAILETQPGLAATRIPGGIYPGVADPVATIGPVALLVAREGTEPALVIEVLEVLIGRLAALRTMHPALAPLQVEWLLGSGAPIPFHPAAEAFFEARGLVGAAGPPAAEAAEPEETPEQ